MPHFIHKEAPDVDFYIEWSTITESPVMGGNREAMLAYLGEDAEERLARADETGTSSTWVRTAGLDERFAEDGAWDDDVYIYKQMGILTRANLFVLVHRLADDLSADDTVLAADLLRPFDDAES